MFDDTERQCVERARDHVVSAQAHWHATVELLPTRIWAASSHTVSVGHALRDWLSYLDGVLGLDDAARKGAGKSNG